MLYNRKWTKTLMKPVWAKLYMLRVGRKGLDCNAFKSGRKDKLEVKNMSSSCQVFSCKGEGIGVIGPRDGFLG
jgi:hypothetical protein